MSYEEFSQLAGRGERFPPDVDSKVLLAYAKLAGEKGDWRMILLCVIALRDRDVKIPLDTIAIEAARAGHMNVITWIILKFGWEVQPQVIENVDQIDWEDVAFYAAYEGHLELLKFLLDNKCPINKEEVIEKNTHKSHFDQLNKLLKSYK